MQRLARIVVLTHEYDDFADRRWFWQPYNSIYMLFDVLEALKSFGHTWRLVSGPRGVRGDVGVLHVNATTVGDEYLALASNYRLGINFKTHNIAKRRVSGAILSEAEPWAGSVIIKSNYNFMGWPEFHHNEVAARKHRTLPYPDFDMWEAYAILPSRDAVPPEVWTDKHKVVERFVPELDEQGYALRNWIFMGNRERCTRHVSPEPIVKAGNVVARTPSEVPAEIRAERARLGFDYGKFDFVIHEGQPILLDANRTPSSSPTLRQFLKDGTRNLAEGFHELIVKGR